ncbi:efflux RND transporter periplasmic adaptor subunit [Bradyrhizobium sp. CCBAU 45394]|uniref:efflux RND transporter periplasmic adaptor subunit n=1 Tax=Bradyrhizobium sp. CCBAU 45394 TaxID=1325087 RepID=UPI002303BFD5|nr:efflux RND transporter periplasmic adaptor subunit [Bradyrhizobium sp. CCBAU 45394]
MSEVSIIGLDLAKNVFQMHGADASGTVLFRKKLRRDQVLKCLAAQPTCTVAMEACASSHYWGREIGRLGHAVRLAPDYVKPFVKRQKNDAADAEAICEAAQRRTVRSQVDGKLIAVNFTEGQDVKKGDVVGEIDPALYQATYDQAVAKKAQDQAQLANQRIDLTRYEQLAASNAGSKQQADTQRALVAQTEALVKADQAAIDNAAATLSYTKIVAPISGRAGLRQVDQGNIIHAADTTGLVVITQLQPIAVWFSLPQQQIMRVNAAAAKGALAVDVFGNDGVTVIDTGKLTGIDNQVDQTTGTLRLKAEFPNANYQLWPGQFVNVRLKVETLMQALVVPTSAVQRGPIGTFSYVIGEDNVVSAKPVTVTQQNEHDAVIASGLSANDRVVTTGFANLSDGSKVVVGRDDQTPSADLAPRKRSRGPDAQKKDGAKDGQKDGEPRAKRSSSEGDQKGQTGPAPGPGATGSGAKQP